MVISAIILAVVAAVFMGLYLLSRRDLAARESSLAEARTELARLQERLSNLTADHAQLSAEAEERFRNLAGRVLVSNSELLREQNRRGLAEVIEPMKSDLERFRQLVVERYEREAGERLSLGDRIKDLVQLNHAIGQETRRLTDALKGNAKVQGDWGEMILDNILERSGFRRGQDYTVQETVAGEQGQRLRPDVVISYTEGRKLVIDSKVSIQDYLAMLNADTEECRERHARAHVASVKSHIAELARKSYQDAVGAAKIDFVLMFIPHEGAYLAAMNLDNTLWQTAYDNRVLIISPTHLMSVIKLVEQMWRHEKQNRNAQEIARQAGAMLDKLRGFVDDMDCIDASLNNARAAWNSAFAKLSTGPGNMIARAQKIASLGARSKKELPDRYVDVSGSDDPVES